MSFTNKFGIPQAIYNAIVNDPYDSEGSDITTSQLITPPQIVALQKRYKDKIIEDVSERIWTLLGQSIHLILERAGEKDADIETRYSSDVLGWKVSGQIDTVEDGVLRDWKITSVFTLIYKSRFREWECQNNINNWLRSKKWGSADKIENVLILRDWVKSKAGVGNYPNVQISVVELPLWDLKKTEDYVIERVKLHQEAQKLSDQELASKFPCSIEDRWLNQKTGEFARCKLEGGYCPVRHLCVQNKRKK